MDDYVDLKRVEKPIEENKYFINENGVIESVTPQCPACYSRKVIKWSTTPRYLISTEFQGEVILQRYKCKKCGKAFQTELNGQFDKGCNFSNELKEKSIKVKELNWSSFGDIAEYYKNL